MRYRLTTRAHRDLVNLLTYLGKESPQAAQYGAVQIEKTLDLLIQMPRLGRSSLRPDTREIGVSHFPLLVVYRINADVIEILTIFHTSRNPEDK